MSAFAIRTHRPILPIFRKWPQAQFHQFIATCLKILAFAVQQVMVVQDGTHLWGEIMKTAIWTAVAATAAILVAADAQAGPYGYSGQNGFYYSGTYGQFYPPIYTGPRGSTGGFVSTAPGRSQYQYNTQYGNGAILQQNNRSSYIPNGAGYGYPVYGGYGGGYGGGYNSGFRSRANYGYGW